MNWIKKIRTDAGLTQDGFAKSLNFSRTLIAKWETGKRTPNASQIEYICNALGVDINKYIMNNDFVELINRKRKSIRTRSMGEMGLVIISLFIIIYGFISITKDDTSIYIWSVCFISSGIAIAFSIINFIGTRNLLKDDKRIKILILKQRLPKVEFEKIDLEDQGKINLKINKVLFDGNKKRGA